MRVCILEAPGRAVVREIPQRPLAPDELRIQVCFAGVCGTDLSFFTGQSDFVRRGLVRYPLRFGHEWSGIVEAVGPSVTRFSPGDRVIGDNGVSCGRCAACRAGNWQHCRDGYSVGTIRCWDGCFADSILMPERHVHPLAAGLSLEEAALVEPATIPFGAFTRVSPAGKTVAVIGTGPIGLSAIPFARSLGAGRVYLIGRTPSKMQVGLALGAHEAISCVEQDAAACILERTNGAGADLVLEASGKRENIWLAAEMTAKHGSTALLAFYEQDFGGYAIDRFIQREIQLLGVMGGYGLAGRVAERMARAQISLRPLITHRIGFTQLPDILPKAAGMRDRIKILVDMAR